MFLGHRLHKISRQSSVALIVLLPFLAFFSGSKNVELQALVLAIAGALGSIALLPTAKKLLASFGPKAQILLAVYITAILASWIAHPSGSFFGGPKAHLGIATLVSCIVCSLVLLQYDRKSLAKYIYAAISLLAYISVPYTLLRYHSLERLGGLASQPVILGCIIAVGLVFGLYILRLYPRHKKAILINQAVLWLILTGTQTRAAIILAALAHLIWFTVFKPRINVKKAALISLAVLVSIVFVSQFTSSRLTDTGYAKRSIQYRLDLQADSFKASGQELLFGYGAGNLTKALDCHKLSAASLKETCRNGFKFNSSHNIFLDRALQIGWLGGLAYLGLMLMAIKSGFSGNRQKQIFALALLVITGYYLTNITSPALELLLWVLMIRCLSRASA